MRRVRIAGRCYQCRLMETRSYANQPHRTRLPKARGTVAAQEATLAAMQEAQYDTDFEDDEDDEKEGVRSDRTMLRAALAIQRWFRLCQTRRWLKVWNHDAQLIQNAWRRKKARLVVKARRASAKRERAKEERIAELERERLKDVAARLECSLATAKRRIARASAHLEVNLGG